MTKQETLQFLDSRLAEFLSKSEEEQKALILKAERKVAAMCDKAIMSEDDRDSEDTSK